MKKHLKSKKIWRTIIQEDLKVLKDLKGLKDLSGGSTLLHSAVHYIPLQQIRHISSKLNSVISSPSCSLM